MIKNEQAIQALDEVLAQLEAIAVRTDAIFEFMLERGELNPQEFESIIENAEPRQHAKWAQIRGQVRALLEEEAPRPAAIAGTRI